MPAHVFEVRGECLVHVGRELEGGLHALLLVVTVEALDQARHDGHNAVREREGGNDLWCKTRVNR